jgi:hypothetical protein
LVESRGGSNPQQEMNAPVEKRFVLPANVEPLNWSLISAVNNERVLNSNLLDSPGMTTASEVLLQTDCASAALAYNRGIDRAQSDILVFAHQDVYLPQTWLPDLKNALVLLSKTDPEWAVLGVWGITASGGCAGHVYCGGTMKQLGAPSNTVTEVMSLDEAVLILRKSSGLRFDERLEGFHMYGTDICMEAQRQGMKCYAISAFCIHNTNGYNLLPREFWRNYFFMRNKWSSALPITTSCTKITHWCWPMIWWNIDRAVNLILGRHKAGKRVADPRQLYRQLFRPEQTKAQIATDGISN